MLEVLNFLTDGPWYWALTKMFWAMLCLLSFSPVRV